MAEPEQSPVLQAARRFQDEILRRERAQSMRLVQAYGGVYRKLAEQQAAIEAELVGAPTAGQEAMLARIKALRAQVADELGRFAGFLDTELDVMTREAIERGLSHAQQLALAGLPEAVRAQIAVGWNKLPAEAVERLLGFLGPDSPLHTTIADLGDEVGAEVERLMVEGLALGKNPRVIAHDLVRLGLGKGLDWALNLTRTAQLWAYREATRAGYVANQHIVKGWRWHAELGDKRTCMSCIAQHGSLHSVDEVLNDHHRGRCAMVPVTVSWKELGIDVPETNQPFQTGEEWFKTLSDAEQKDYMGKGAWAAWKAGEFEFKDLSKAYTDPVYGEMLAEASLKDILGEQAKQYYRRGE